MQDWKYIFGEKNTSKELTHAREIVRQLPMDSSEESIVSLGPEDSHLSKACWTPAIKCFGKLLVDESHPLQHCKEGYALAEWSNNSLSQARDLAATRIKDNHMSTSWSEPMAKRVERKLGHSIVVIQLNCDATSEVVMRVVGSKWCQNENTHQREEVQNDQPKEKRRFRTNEWKPARSKPRKRKNHMQVDSLLLT